jgi:hypothetical protein
LISPLFVCDINAATMSARGSSLLFRLFVLWRIFRLRRFRLRFLFEEYAIEHVCHRRDDGA